MSVEPDNVGLKTGSRVRDTKKNNYYSGKVNYKSSAIVALSNSHDNKSVVLESLLRFPLHCHYPLYFNGSSWLGFGCAGTASWG